MKTRSGALEDSELPASGILPPRASYGRLASPRRNGRSILCATALLSGLGVVMSLSATAPLALEARIPPHFLRHLVALTVGTLAAGIAFQIPLRIWRRAALPLWLVALGLLIATALAGIEVNGAKRWLLLPGGLRFQPAEIVKWATLLCVAATLAEREGHRELSVRQFLRAIGLCAPPVFLLLLQPDFGNAVLLAGLVSLLLFVAGVPLRHMAGTALLGAQHARPISPTTLTPVAESSPSSNPLKALAKRAFSWSNPSWPLPREAGSASDWETPARSSSICQKPTRISSSHWWPRSSGCWAPPSYWAPSPYSQWQESASAAARGTGTPCSSPSE